MKTKFDLAKEFPNYFLEAAQRIASLQPGAKDASVVQVEKLLSANLQAILNRLNLIYVDIEGQPATEHFFQKLVENMQACLPKGAKKEDLEVYISGGVVRTLLAYIYKELYTTMQHRDVNQDNTNEKITKAKELQRKSRYLQIRNRLVEQYKTLNIEAVCNEFAGSNQQERKIINDLYHYLGEHLSEKGIFDVNSTADNGLYQAYLSLNNQNHQSAYSELWQAMDRAEYHLLRSYMIDHTPLSQAFVLGVGSDLDILYQLKGDLSKDLILGETIKQVATNFINSAQSHFKLRDAKDPFKHSLIPLGDVNEYDEQIGRALEQGGSLLDALAFKLPNATESNISNIKSRFKQPLHAGQPIPVIKNFIEGIYDYLTTGKATQKQTVRGLRALLEIPFLQLSTEGKKIITDELEKMRNDVQKGGVEPRAMMQIEKMIRNAHFSGAHNRAFREEKDAPLAIFLDIVSNIQTTSAEKINKAFPKFLDALGQKHITGRHQDAITQLLLPNDEFIKQHTKDGTLYHGTSTSGVLPILRGGFFISDDTQGAVKYGSGLYTTKDKATAASYARTEGVILELQINPSKPLRIINKSNLPEWLKELLKEEAIDKNVEINQLLREEYGIDIIIDTHVIVQNLDSLLLPNDFSPIIKSIAEELEKKQLTESISCAELQKYISFYQLAEYLSCPMKSIPHPQQYVVSTLNSLALKMRNGLSSERNYWLELTEFLTTYQLLNEKGFDLSQCPSPDQLVHDFFHSSQVNLINDNINGKIGLFELIKNKHQNRVKIYLPMITLDFTKKDGNEKTLLMHVSGDTELMAMMMPLIPINERFKAIMQEVYGTSVLSQSILNPIVLKIILQSLKPEEVLKAVTSEIAQNNLDPVIGDSPELLKVVLGCLSRENRILYLTRKIFNFNSTHIHTAVRSSETLKIIFDTLDVELMQELFEFQKPYAEQKWLASMVHAPDTLKTFFNLLPKVCREKLLTEPDNQGDYLILNTDFLPDAFNVIWGLYDNDQDRLSILNKQNPMGQTILHMSAYNMDFLKKALSLYPDQNSYVQAIMKRNYLEETVLHSHARNPDILKILLERFSSDEARLKAIQETANENTVLACSATNINSLKMIFSLFPHNKDRLQDLLLKELVNNTYIREQLAVSRCVEQVLDFVPVSYRLKILLLPQRDGGLFLTNNVYDLDSISKRVLILPETDRWKAIVAQDNSNKCWLDDRVKTAQDCQLLLNISNHHPLVALKLMLLKPNLMQTIRTEMSQDNMIQALAQVRNDTVRNEVITEIDTLMNNNQHIIQLNDLIHSLKFLSIRLPYREQKLMYIELLRNAFNSIANDSKKGAVSFFTSSNVRSQNQAIALQTLLDVLDNPDKVDVAKIHVAVIENTQFAELTREVARIDGFESLDELFEHYNEHRPDSSVR